MARIARNTVLHSVGLQKLGKRYSHADSCSAGPGAWNGHRAHRSPRSCCGVGQMFSRRKLVGDHIGDIEWLLVRIENDFLSSVVTRVLHHTIIILPSRIITLGVGNSKGTDKVFRYRKLVSRRLKL